MFFSQGTSDESMMYIKRFSALFSILLAIVMYCEVMGHDIINWIAKPLLMPVLMVMFLLNSRKNLPLERKCMVTALFFSCGGDILLMLSQYNLFIFGLISFLIAHISYIVLFLVRLQYQRDKRQYDLTASKIIVASIPFLLYISTILYIVVPTIKPDRAGTNGLLVPVIIYTLVIVSMAYTSFLRDQTVPGFWTVFFGTLFFVLSDSLLAINKFVIPITTPGVFIMLTYGIGQYLITIGTLQTATNDIKTI